jgi:hypothetical protein
MGTRFPDDRRGGSGADLEDGWVDISYRPGRPCPYEACWHNRQGPQPPDPLDPPDRERATPGRSSRTTGRAR